MLKVSSIDSDNALYQTVFSQVDKVKVQFAVTVPFDALLQDIVYASYIWSEACLLFL